MFHRTITGTAGVLRPFAQATPCYCLGGHVMLGEPSDRLCPFFDPFQRYVVAIANDSPQRQGFIFLPAGSSRLSRLYRCLFHITPRPLVAAKLSIFPSSLVDHMPTGYHIHAYVAHVILWSTNEMLHQLSFRLVMLICG